MPRCPPAASAPGHCLRTAREGFTARPFPSMRSRRHRTDVRRPAPQLLGGCLGERLLRDGTVQGAPSRALYRACPLLVGLDDGSGRWRRHTPRLLPYHDRDLARDLRGGDGLPGSASKPWAGAPLALAFCCRSASRRSASSWQSSPTQRSASASCLSVWAPLNVLPHTQDFGSCRSLTSSSSRPRAILHSHLFFWGSVRACGPAECRISHPTRGASHRLSVFASEPRCASHPGWPRHGCTPSDLTSIPSHTRAADSPAGRLPEPVDESRLWDLGQLPYRLGPDLVPQAVPELAAKLPQPADGKRAQQARHGVGRQHGLLVGLVEARAQLGQELVVGNACKSSGASAAARRAHPCPKEPPLACRHGEPQLLKDLLADL